MGWWQRLADLVGMRLNQNDQAFVESYLNDAGQFLFKQMSTVDQRHAVRVARFIIQEASFRRGVDLERLVQAALLHDAGKVRGEIGWFCRLLVGIIRRMLPGSRHKWAKRDKSSRLRYALYVDVNHASRGAYMAESLGLDPEVASLIKRHHDENPGDNDPELSLLKTADEKN